jgi:hypothetical protein
MNQLRWLALTSLLPFCLNAQPISDPGDLSHFIFARNHFSVSIMGGIAVKADVTANPYKYDLGSSHQIAFGGGLNYHQNFSRDLSLIIGIHMAAPVRNMEYHIPKGEFSPPLEYDLYNFKGISRTAVFLLRLPVTLERRWFSSDDKYTYVSAGISLNYSGMEEERESHMVMDANNQPRRYFSMYLQPNNNGKPWLNYHVSGGHSWMLKNKNFLSAGIIANLSLTRFTKGTFSLDVPNQPSVTGHYSLKGSYAGLTVGYIYTGAKKRLKQIKK